MKNIEIKTSLASIFSILISLSLYAQGYDVALAQTKDEITLKVQVLGVVAEKETSPLAGAKITVSPKNKEIEFRETKMTDGDGATSFVLPMKTSYNILAEAMGYGSEVTVVDLTGLEGEVSFLVVVLQRSSEMGWAGANMNEYLVSMMSIIVLGETTALLWLIRRRSR